MATPAPADVKPPPSGPDGVWSFKLYGCAGPPFVLNGRSVTNSKMVGTAMPPNRATWDLTLKMPSPTELEVSGPITGGDGTPGRWRSSATLKDGVFRGYGELTFPGKKGCTFEAVRSW